MVSLCKAQTYSLAQLEASFIEHNYSLIASKFAIGRAEAEIVQEKLWPNPNLAIGEVNLWANANSETMPPLIGNYGRTQQVSVELEQLIETAGKRKKRVAIKQLEQRAAVYEFEELVRELKKELRQTFFHVASTVQERDRLALLVAQFAKLNTQYSRQAAQQNVSKADYYRIQTELVSLQRELVEIEDDLAEGLQTLRVLTRQQGLTIKQLDFQLAAQQQIKPLPADVKELALAQNIGLKQQQAQVDLANTQLVLEKAQRKPDVTLQLGYDRGGNIMQDFIGVGLSLDLPVFNRNKGNIKAAQFQVETEKANQQALQWTLENVLDRLSNQLLNYQQTLEVWPVEATEGQLHMVENYQKHLQSGQVTLMEFIDFAQAAREAHKAYVETWENYNKTYEELQYLVGEDF